MKVFIINDTSGELHHGCSRVMNNLCKLIKTNKGQVIASSPVGLDWRKSEATKAKMLEADLVIVNGEGTIHHDSGEHLLDVGLFCKPYGVKTALVNALFQDMTIATKEQLKAFDHISVRDSFSKKQIESYGLEVELLPDLTFYSIGDYAHRKDIIHNRWMFTCSVNIEKSIELFRLSKKGPMHSIFTPVVYGKGNWEENTGSSSILEKFSRFGFSEFILKSYNRIKSKLRSKGFRQYSDITLHNKYYNAINNVDFIISGRFHSVCFAINCGVPFIALTSNSHKLEALIEDFGLSKERIVSNVESLNNIKYLPYSKEEINNIKVVLHDIQSKYEMFYKKVLDK
ncbi:hypothetical protein A6E05_10215 [Aliivibrio sp. 1S165]|uniref:polysaccharide pyruvyl transferase family protein n=1 Tax=unclassified Aliivibrio TaxID=2645654 RepID=UPI00080D9E6F|nr:MULTISPECIES: polysaccharide pyruvyl transferase family protein [unclassified Aliivibrio]OCH11938.1 hypothetical protein A6E05_10215 [Aliivibrio sp. 1S165]OCH35864.1 hypothetical protein A6E06_10945 [Aliivibrio sp. 1S175]